MTSEKLNALIEKEKKNLVKFKAKKAEYDEKVKKTEAKLQQYEMLQNNDKFNALTNIVQQSGLSMEDVFAALQSGNLLDLQEQMEAAQAAQKALLEENNDEMNGDSAE